MNRTRKWAIFGAILVVTGLIICWISYALLGFDFRKLSTVEYTDNTYSVNGSFKDIKIDADTEIITFLPSSDGKCTVECHEIKDAPHEVKNSNNTLIIAESQKKKSWNISFQAETPSITIYLPEKEYGKLRIDSDTGDVMIPIDFSFEEIEIDLDTGDVNCLASAKGKIEIKTDTGDISLADVSAENMDLKSHTGKIELSDIKLNNELEIKEDTGAVLMENVSCKQFGSKGSTGKLNMVNVVAEDKFDLERDTGSIEFKDCDGKDIKIKTSTGKVTGSLLTGKNFSVKSSTGKIDVPESSGTGTCEIKTDTGNITITIS